MNRWPQFPSRIVVMAGAVGAVASAFIASTNAAKLSQSYWPATRGHVAEEIQRANDKTLKVIDRIESRQINTQLYIANMQRKNLENEIASKEALLKQSPQMQWEAKAIVEEQIRNLNRELELTKKTAEGLARESVSRP